MKEHIPKPPPTHRQRTKPASPYSESDRKMIKWGWWMTFLFTPVGAIIGIILLTRNIIKHGALQVSISMLYLFVFAPMIFGGGNFLQST